MFVHLPTGHALHWLYRFVLISLVFKDIYYLVALIGSPFACTPNENKQDCSYTGLLVSKCLNKKRRKLILLTFWIALIGFLTIYLDKSFRQVVVNLLRRVRHRIFFMDSSISSGTNIRRILSDFAVQSFLFATKLRQSTQGEKWFKLGSWPEIGLQEGLPKKTSLSILVVVL